MTTGTILQEWTINVTKVEVQLFNGRRVVGIVKAVADTVSGRKVRISSGALALEVGAEQVTRIVSQ
jgi:hypothetical protein